MWQAVDVTAALTDDPTETLAAAVDSPPVASKEGAFLIVHDRRADEIIRALSEGGEITFGRADNVTLQIDDHTTSRLHARVRLVDGQMFLDDLGSRNGTLLNGKVIRGETVKVYGGDVVQVGSVRINIVYGNPEGRSAGISGTNAEETPIAEGVVVVDPRMAEIYQLVRKVAPQRTTVLILGETGVGKELIAQHVHIASPRARQPFVRLNCAALPDNLLESELFGYEKGAFSGADRKKVGYFEAAHQGTLFLDEVGELSPAMQVKLLAVLENRVITRLGGVKEIPIDVRVVCATHRDLEAAVRGGRFREDLYYRISTFRLRVPPLRERRAELRPLALRFARDFAADMKVELPEFTEEALQAIERHPWPGNVRELRNAIEYAVVMAQDGQITPAELPEDFSRGR